LVFGGKMRTSVRRLPHCGNGTGSMPTMGQSRPRSATSAPRSMSYCVGRLRGPSAGPVAPRAIKARAEHAMTAIGELAERAERHLGAMCLAADHGRGFCTAPPSWKQSTRLKPRGRQEVVVAFPSLHWGQVANRYYLLQVVPSEEGGVPEGRP